MNWLQVTQSFLPLTREQTSSFAPPREIDLAVAAYNRAIRNLNQDSADIALIALRKLSSDYPDFLEAGLLYGCCLAQLGQMKEARAQLIRTASHPQLPEDLSQAAEAAIRAVDQELAEQEALTVASPKAGLPRQAGSQVTLSDLPVRPSDALLERTGRKSRVRMASEKERREILMRSDMPREEETHVVFEKSPADYLRLILPVAAGLMVIAVLVFVLVRAWPDLRREKPASADEKLAYLLGEIEKKAPADEAWQRLLTDYRTRFQIEPTTAASSTAGTSAQTSQPTTMATTTATTTMATTTALPTPSLTPTPTQAPELAILREADSLVSTGMDALDEDLVLAAESLMQAIDLLEGIPADTTSADIDRTAGELLDRARAQYEPIYKRAAEQLRLIAAPLFGQAEYEQSLSYYLRAYALYPKSYGGGVAYYCGRCYQLLDKPDEARTYFEFVVENFDGRDIAVSAAYRLTQLG